MIIPEEELREEAAPSLRRKAFTMLQVALAVVIIVVCARAVGARTILELLRSANPGWIGVAFLFAAFTVWLGAEKLALLAAPPASDLPAATARRLYLKAWTLDQFIPGGWGSVSLIYFLKREGMSLKAAAAMFALDKTATIFLELLLAGVGVWILHERVHYTPPAFGPAFGAIALAVFIATGLAVYAFFSTFVRALLFARDAVMIRSRILPRYAVVLVLRAFIQGIAFWAAFRGLGDEIPYLVIVPLVHLSGLAGYLPISFQGIGTVETAAVFTFCTLGTTGASVVAAFLIVRASYYLLAALFLAAEPLRRSVP